MKSKKNQRLLALILSMVLMLSASISAMAEGDVQTGASGTEVTQNQTGEQDPENEASAASYSADVSEAGVQEEAGTDTQSAEITEEETAQGTADQDSEDPETADQSAVEQGSQAQETPAKTAGTVQDETSTAAGNGQENTSAMATDTQNTETQEEASVSEEQLAETTEETVTGEKVVSEATELKQEFTDEDGNVTQTVTAQVPEGAFQATKDQISMEVKLLNEEDTNYIKGMMEKKLPEGFYLDGYVLYQIDFKVNGEITKPVKAITISMTGNKLAVEDTKNAHVFYYMPEDPEVEDDEDQLTEVTQKDQLIKSLEESGQSTENIEDFDYSEIKVNEGNADTITVKGWESTIYGCYVEAVSAETTFTEKVGDTVVKVTVPEGAFPMSADEITMTAKELTKEQKTEIEDQLSQQAEEGQKLKDYVAFDIDLWAGEEKVQPQAPVNVTFENTGLEQKKGETTFGFQLSEEENTINQIPGEVTEKGDLEVRAEHFTVTGAVVYKEEETAAFTEADPLAEGDNTETEGSILTADMLQPLNDNTSNQWQIVAGGYESNTPANKEPSGDGNVRVQKNVIPTAVENEFLVYLSIDTKQSFQEYFQMRNYYAAAENNPSAVTGDPVTITSDEVLLSTNNEAEYDAYATFTFTYQGEIIAEDVVVGWDHANNHTIYIELSNGQQFVVKSSVKFENKYIIDIPFNMMEEIKEDITQAAQLDSVIDQMGAYIEFEEVIDSDSVEIPDYNESDKTLIWEPEVKSNPKTIEEVVETEDGKTITTTWSLNVAELVYRIRLNVEKAGFNSCADNMDSKTGDPESYKVNEQATLYYNNGKEVYFPTPYVRGLLYEFRFQKVDADDPGKVLSGAEFTLTADSKEYTATEKNGYYQFSGIPWGQYTLTETAPPDGYKLGEISAWSGINIGYTLDLQDGTAEIDKHIHVDESKYYRWIGFYGNEGWVYDDDIIWKITNKKIKIDFVKIDADTKKAVSGAVFDLYNNNNEKIGTATSDVNGQLDFLDVKFSVGEDYYLVETNAPEGYQKIEEKLEFTIQTDGSVTVMSGNPVIQITGLDDTDTYTISISNILIPLGKIEIQKISSTDSSKPLSGAVFKIQKKNDKGDFVDMIDEKEKPIICKTNEEGIAYFKDLEYGDYQLVEIEAPQGYSLLKEPVSVTVGKDSLEDGVVIKKVENIPIYSLPSAGGPGIFLYMIGGTLLLMAGSLMIYINRRREVLRR